jgi:outer membrane protein assembly factor BamB
MSGWRLTLLAALGLLLGALPASAVIQRPIPLKDVLASEEFIFVASVDSVLPEKPAAVFKFEEHLKGKAPFDRLPLNLTGNAEAKKQDHTRVMLDRLESGRKLVVFTRERGKHYDATAFLEGTWFSMQGTIDADGKTVRWAFLSCEPYLRRTFKGTTAELKKVVEDALAKRADPPPLNEKEPPGFGPALKKETGDGEQETEKGQAASPPVSCSPSPVSCPLFGVIPSFVLVGPLALIAALFPGVAARLAVGMRRWRAFLVVASVNSTLAIVYYFTRSYLPDWPVFSYRGFTGLLLGSTAIGLLWAGRRYRRMAGEDPAITLIPSRRELYTLAGLTALIALIVASVRLFGPWSLALDLPMREFTLIGIALFAATLYAGYRLATGASDRLPDGREPPLRLSLSGECVGLAMLFLGGLVAILIGSRPAGAPATLGTFAGDSEQVFGPRLVDVKVFEIADAHQVMSSGLAVDGDRLFLGASRQGGFGNYGLVFALDRNIGKQLWAFEGDDDLKPVFCAPTISDGKVYFGEGLHTDSGCRLFCLDAASGKPAWQFPTASHTEGTPLIASGKVYFTAGDDGLYCVDAKTGERKWQFAGQEQQLHIDGPPALSSNRVFVGSGLYTLALLAVDTETGKVVWRTPVNLRSFGPPLVLGDRVVYGLGTGNLSADIFQYAEENGRNAETAPAGAVVCVNAANGHEVWRYNLSRSVHTPLAADAFSVYATSRDGAVHCLDRKTGRLRWKTGIGATITAGPAVATTGGFPVAAYAISTEGLMTCLNPQTGKVAWARDLREETRKLVSEVYTTPEIVVESTPKGSRRVIYTGAMLENVNNRARTAAVFRFEDVLGE